MNVTEMQTRLAARGYSLVPDGRYGPMTRAAVLAALTDPPDRRITATDVAALAAGWQVDPAVIWAVRDVEATGSPFIDGRPTLLFEPHRFSRATAHRYDTSQPGISYRAWGARAYPLVQARRYDQLLDAVALDVDAGFASASYGAFQVLGENWRICGETDPMAFALAEAEGEDKQLGHFTRFCASNGLVPALRRLDWAAFAQGYNGTGFRANRYDERLATAYSNRNAA